MFQTIRQVYTNKMLRMNKSSLVVFDFDHTIVDDNTDTVARNLIPRDSLACAEETYKKTDSWTLYMREIFIALHKMNISKQELITAVKNIPPIKDMDTLIKRLDNNLYELIIISDSNSIFISEWLSYHNFDKVFRKIITNPAWFDDSDLLNIEFYQHQTFCNISEPNLCKGYAMETYIDERKKQNIEFNSIFFIGDGSNDYCPTLKLKESDYVFPRVNYSLDKKIKANAGAVKAKVYPWHDGSDIIKAFEENIELKNSY